MPFSCFGSFFKCFSGPLTLGANHADTHMNHLTHIFKVRGPVPLPGKKCSSAAGASTVLFQRPTSGQEEPPLFPSFDYKICLTSPDNIINTIIINIIIINTIIINIIKSCSLCIKGQFKALIWFVLYSSEKDHSGQ